MALKPKEDPGEVALQKVRVAQELAKRGKLTREAAERLISELPAGTEMFSEPIMHELSPEEYYKTSK
jgi:polyhydroxyalkanoate synthesis regulator phasin